MHRIKIECPSTDAEPETNLKELTEAAVADAFTQIANAKNALDCRSLTREATHGGCNVAKFFIPCPFE